MFKLELDLPCLANRNMRGDLTEVYKMFTEKIDTEISTPITRAKDVHDRHVVTK